MFVHGERERGINGMAKEVRNGGALLCSPWTRPRRLRRGSARKRSWCRRTTNMETPYLGSHRIGRWLRSTSWSKCWLGGLGGGARYLPCRCQWISAV
ncbi:hypothetical protein BRADI_3g19931v3 [Brachypodium distachyon]|uniref:Uncharacterized protein n=1 Tax=Brachypodium distachyon TaxID=15368 RepID=A0A2K2CYF3_BRADI|nr:hypothetical protein BRADI_3g19931v3 [Brachypodium distachyon]